MMAMKFDEGFKEVIKWVLGIASAFILMSVKNSYDTQSQTNKQLQEKVDKVYDFSTNHEVRMAVIEKQIEEHSQKILDLQLARERMQTIQHNIKEANKQLDGQ